MAKRQKAWEIGLHVGRQLGVPASMKGIITGVGAGMTLGGLADNDQPILILGLLTAVIGITA